MTDVYDTAARAWKTILVGTMGRGGPGVVALDVTDPAAVRFLWEKNGTDIPSLGKNTNVPNWPALGCSTEGDMGRYYSFPAPTIGAELRTYTISAVPTTSQAAKDGGCGTLTLNQAGARSPTTNTCW